MFEKHSLLLQKIIYIIYLLLLTGDPDPRERYAYAHPLQWFWYFGGLLVCGLQVAQKVTHVECFLYLKKRPVAPKLVLAAFLIWLLDPIAAAVWPWILV